MYGGGAGGGGGGDFLSRAERERVYDFVEMVTFPYTCLWFVIDYFASRLS